MKRLLTAILLASSMAGIAGATSISYDQVLANTVVTTTTSYIIDASTTVIDLLSAQASMSAASPTVQSFKDGTPSTGTITISNFSALATQASSDTITVSNNAMLIPTAGTVKVIVSSQGTTGILSGSTLTIAGVNLYPGTHWNIGASSAATTISIAAAINQYLPNLTATIDSVNGATITVTCTVTGAFCNNYRVTTSTVAVKFSTSGLSNLFTGGADNAQIILNGYAFKQGEAWSKQDVSSNTAISIMNAIDALGAFTASTNTTTSVLIKCAATGTLCNGYTLTTLGTGLTALAGTFAAGQDNAFLKINGVILTQGTDFTAATSSAATANSIAAAINANTSLNTIMVATAPLTCPGASPCGVVKTTGAVVTSPNSNNYPWFSSSSTAMAISNSSLFGGTTGAYTLNSPTLVMPSHGFATGAEVKYTTGVVTIGGLSNSTTYYVIKVDADDIQLALTSTGAVAGLYITLASTSTTGPHQFTLTPGSLTGTLNLTWQASDDRSNWSNISVSALSFGTPYTSTSTLWDFGAVNSRYFRALLSGPDSGGVNVTIRAVGKRYGNGL